MAVVDEVKEMYQEEMNFVAFLQKRAIDRKWRRDDREKLFGSMNQLSKQATELGFDAEGMVTKARKWADENPDATFPNR